VRRTVLTIAATIAGLVMLLQFKTQSPGGSTGGLATLGPVSTTSPKSSPASTPSRRKTSSAPRSHHHKIAGSPSATASATVTAPGQTVQTRYGPVQVVIVETAGQLTNITAIQLPRDNSHSREIAATAVPILRSEALRSNSARIDIVSGATYTSDGYAQSLQSALDNA
jgi:uncharacterized protein with FMN-binding domain